MLLPTFFKIGFRNVKLHWHHSLAALLSISVGFSSITVFECYTRDIEKVYDSIFSKRGMLGDIVIDSSRQENMLDADAKNISPDKQKFIEEFIRTQGSAVNKVRFLNVFGTINSSTTSTVFSGLGFDTKEGATMRQSRWHWDTLGGKPLDLGNERSILLGKDLARTLGCSATGPAPQFALADGFDPVERPFSCQYRTVRANVTTESGQFNARDFTPLGIVSQGFQEIDSKYVLMPLEAAQKLLKTNDVSFYSVLLKNKNLVSGFVDKFNRQAKQQGFSLRATRWQDHPFGDIAVRSMEVLGVLRHCILSVIFAIVFVSVLSSLIKNVRERRREIGTLRSMGYLKRHVVTIFAIEGSFLGVLGSLGGIAISLVDSLVINAVRFPYRAGFLSDPDRLRVAYALDKYVQSTLFLGLLVIGAAVFASARTAMRKIPENLE